ncbi:IPT/TIG domain-containing protein [Bacteroidota bacterium]
MERVNKYNREILISFSFLLLILLGSCNEDVYVEEIIDEPPLIESFSPENGYNGTLITVVGQYLRGVDSAAFGDGQAVIHRIVNNEEIILKVTNASKSGKITLRSPKGTVSSMGDFTMEYVTPLGNEWPIEGTINQDVSILGENLQSVTKVTLQSLGSTEIFEGEIVFQRNDELALRVPYVAADWSTVDNVRATISLTYATESGEETITGPQYQFSAKKPEFEVTSWPTAVLENSEVNILGLNINLADSVYFGDYLATIVKATPISLTVLVPDIPEREFLNMRIVYFRTLEKLNEINTEVYTKYRKTLGNFEGGLSSIQIRDTRISEGVNWSLTQSTDDPLPSPEGTYYASYTSDPDPANKSSVPIWFNYNEGEGNLINLDAFTDPVLHFYYFNDSTAAYLQLEIVVGGTKMRLYNERYRTNKSGWELVCIRLAEAEFGAGYGGPYAPLPYKNAYEEIHINYKPDGTKETEFHIDNVFISEGAIKGAIDLTKHTAENNFKIDIVD